MKLEEELQMSEISNPHHRATLNIIFTGAWMSERMNRRLKPYEISEQQYNILRILKGQKGKSLNLNDISGRMVHKMSNTTRLIEKLRIKGLVERVICPDNRRKVNISILPEGITLLDKIASGDSMTIQSPTENLTEQEATTLALLLDKVRD